MNKDILKHENNIRIYKSKLKSQYESDNWDSAIFTAQMLRRERKLLLTLKLEALKNDR